MSHSFFKPPRSVFASIARGGGDPVPFGHQKAQISAFRKETKRFQVIAGRHSRHCKVHPLLTESYQISLPPTCLMAATTCPTRAAPWQRIDCADLCSGPVPETIHPEPSFAFLGWVAAIGRGVSVSCYRGRRSCRGAGVVGRVVSVSILQMNLLLVNGDRQLVAEMGVVCRASCSKSHPDPSGAASRASSRRAWSPSRAGPPCPGCCVVGHRYQGGVDDLTTRAM
jgi:hypothetical protein